MKQLWHNITTSAAVAGAVAEPGGGHWTKQINLPVEKICGISVRVCVCVKLIFGATIVNDHVHTSIFDEHVAGRVLFGWPTTNQQKTMTTTTTKAKYNFQALLSLFTGHKTITLNR